MDVKGGFTGSREGQGGGSRMDLERSLRARRMNIYIKHIENL